MNKQIGVNLFLPLKILKHHTINNVFGLSDFVLSDHGPVVHIISWSGLQETDMTLIAGFYKSF